MAFLQGRSLKWNDNKENMLRWMESEFAIAESRPDTIGKWLPPGIYPTKRSVYEAFALSFATFSGGEDGKVPSEDAFRSMWAKSFPEIKVRADVTGFAHPTALNMMASCIALTAYDTDLSRHMHRVDAGDHLLPVCAM